VASSICKGRACVNVEALRRVLGATAILEAASTLKASGRPTVNAAQLWRYFTTSVYASGDLPVIATREALQNSVDAIRASIRQRQIGPKEGRFDVVWEESTRTLSFADNGIGMDAETILGKFLSLGDSGKTDATDSEQAAGGFGIAKAVILGVSETFRWELYSRDNHAVSKGAGQEISVYEVAPRQGSMIRIYDIPEEYLQWWVYERDRSERLLDRLRVLLAANDLPDLRLTLNGELVKPLFNRRGGKPISRGGDWGSGNTAEARAYRRPPGEAGGAVYVRLGGLYQFAQSSAAKLPADVVVDLRTTTRPGIMGYPLTAARDRLQGRASYALNDLVAEIEKENESVADNADYEIFLPEDDHGEEGDPTHEALSDPALLGALQAAASGVADYYRHKPALHGEEPSSLAPLGSKQRSEDPVATPTADLERYTAAALVGRDPIVGAVATVKILLAQTGALGAHVEEALDRTALAGRVREEDQSVLVAAVHTAASTAASDSLMPGAGGLLQAGVAEAQLAPLSQLLPNEPRNRNPFGHLAGLRISRKSYDRAKARRFRKEWSRWLPYLVIWDATLRLVAAEARIKRRFSPGFILDDNKAALVAEEGSDGRLVVYIHPTVLRGVALAHKERPLSIAYYLFGLACHELTHLDGMMGDGHSERFVARREWLGFKTAHLLEPIAELVTRVLGLRSPKSRQTEPSEDYTEIDSVIDSVVRGVGSREMAAFAKRRRADLRKLVKKFLNNKGEL
jgi:hypothetical protein